MLSSCSGRNSSQRDVALIVNSDSLPSMIKQLTAAVAKDDSAAFASLIMYPLERPYPLHNINSPAEMKAYYRTLVDDTLRDVITRAVPADWEQFGWRGWSIGDGQYVWLDDSIYAFNYVSAAETSRLNDLRAKEINSLDKQLRGNWTPVECLRAEGSQAVYRLDRADNASDKAPVYRLAVYRSPEGMRGKPAAILTGYREIEGTMALSHYLFKSPDGSTALYIADTADGSDPTIEFDSPSGADTTVTVVPAYWLDILPAK